MDSKKVTILVVLAVMLVSWTSSTQAQTPPDMSCIQALMPCAQFINATTPPATCCEPLRKAFDTQLACLCSTLQNPSLAAAANVNMTEAMELPTKCGLDISDPNICNKGQAKAPALAPVAGGPATTTPNPGAESNAASSTIWTGPIFSFMLLLAGLMFF